MSIKRFMKGVDGRVIYRPAQQPSLAAEVHISYAKAGLLALLHRSLFIFPDSIIR